MSRKVSRGFIRFFSGLPVVIGGSALWKVIDAAGGNDLSEPVSTFFLAAGMIVLGYCGYRYAERDYRGGARSMLGAFVAFLGVLLVPLTFETSPLSDVGLLVSGIVTGVLFIAIGAGLLRSGHQRHCRLVEEEAAAG
jgi:hypothetical protein